MDVVVVGACNMDLISYVGRLPSPGETVLGSEFRTGFGGKGANQAVMAARLGARVAMVSKVGSDHYGRETIANFLDNQVDTTNVFVDDSTATGVAPITVDREGANTIIVVPGSNMKLNTTEIDAIEQLLSKSKVLICQLEILPEVTYQALEIAKRNEVITIFNPSPAGLILPSSIYSLCSIICLNETETEVITGIKVNDESTTVHAGQLLLDKGCSTVIITLGGQGAYVVSRKESVEGEFIAAPAVAAVDTSGAGDAFLGSLSYYLSVHPHLSSVEAARRAVRIASMSVSRKGTQTSFPHRLDVDSELLR